jgi:CheY-like chemotaxis protein
MHSVSNKGPYILYIEDNAEDVEILRSALEGTLYSFNIIHISDGLKALDFLEQSKQFNRFPEIIFLDVNLSKMNGKEVVVCLKADKDIARIPLTILSASNLDADIAYFRKFQVPYIIKQGDHRRFREEVIEVMKGLLAFDYDFSSSRKNTDAA